MLKKSLSGVHILNRCDCISMLISGIHSQFFLNKHNHTHVQYIHAFSQRAELIMHDLSKYQQNANKELTEV